MPSAFTAMIPRGVTFEQFAWGCARQFSYLSPMRDNSLYKPVPERFEVDPLYVEKLKTAKDELARIGGMGIDEAAKEAKKDFNRTARRNRERRVKIAELKNKLLAMRDRVSSWVPPPGYESLKDFMLSQIDESLRFDCHACHAYQEKLPTTDPSVWLEKKRVGLEDDVARWQKSLDEETKRIEECNEWIRVLRTSIPQPEVK
jgi:hypothetical protein